MKKSYIANLPTLFGMFDIQAWHDKILNTEHIVIKSNQYKKSNKKVPIVRLHSECLTGDIFGSYLCDCGEQLKESLKIIHKNQGILIYLRGHEGRGIGIFNKINAYTLQENNINTVDANHALGFQADERDYSGAVAILKELNVLKLKLLTNNPLKEKFLKNNNIQIIKRISLELPPQKYNIKYLQTKKNLMNHSFILDNKKHII